MHLNFVTKKKLTLNVTLQGLQGRKLKCTNKSKCLGKTKNNIFQYDHLRFTQLGGIAKGTQLAPFLAAICQRFGRNFA